MIHFVSFQAGLARCGAESNMFTVRYEDVECVFCILQELQETADKRRELEEKEEYLLTLYQVWARAFYPDPPSWEGTIDTRGIKF